MLRIGGKGAAVAVLIFDVLKGMLPVWGAYELGVSPLSLAQEGATSSAVGFNIQLNDCDTTVADKAAIAFLGTAIDGTHPNVLALQSSAAGSATKVGVQILDRTGAALALDGATFFIFF